VETPGAETGMFGVEIFLLEGAELLLNDWSL
jgi:phosphoribosylaminoimidazole carboxylase (NCAIR synthetase)